MVWEGRRVLVNDEGLSDLGGCLYTPLSAAHIGTVQVKIFVKVTPESIMNVRSFGRPMAETLVEA